MWLFEMGRDISKDPNYLMILNIISKEGRGYPDKIAYKLGVSRQAVDYRLRRLAEEGYIKKKRNDKIYYVITQRGLEILSIQKMPSKNSEYRVADLLKFIPFLGIAMGLITFGQFIASGDIPRGVIGLSAWIILSLIGYIILEMKISE